MNLKVLLNEQKNWLNFLMAYTWWTTISRILIKYTYSTSRCWFLHLWSETKPGGFLRGKCSTAPLNSTDYAALTPIEFFLAYCFKNQHLQVRAVYIIDNSLQGNKALLVKTAQHYWSQTLQSDIMTIAQQGLCCLIFNSL